MERFPANPGSLKGLVTLVDDGGTAWVLHRKHVDLRIVRRLVMDPAVTVVWGDMGGISPRLVTGGRVELWVLLKHAYRGPGGVGPSGRYVADEFRAQPEGRMLYVEDNC